MEEVQVGVIYNMLLDSNERDLIKICYISVKGDTMIICDQLINF